MTGEHRPPPPETAPAQPEIKRSVTALMTELRKATGELKYHAIYDRVAKIVSDATNPEVANLVRYAISVSLNDMRRDELDVLLDKAEQGDKPA